MIFFHYRTILFITKDQCSDFKSPPKFALSIMQNMDKNREIKIHNVTVSPAIHILVDLDDFHRKVKISKDFLIPAELF